MSSPFKFLDAFERADKAIFFGRSAEVAQLYRLVFEASLVLVYGTSGTGKTSLIQCGLANRFAETDWFQLFVRRGDDINLSLDREIRSKALTEIDDGSGPVEAIRSLYLDHLRPVYLIFDQFEELFILGSKEEQDRFFETAAAIVASDVSCKIIISLREEYLASLHRFEEVLPTLFNKRLRVEPMSMHNVEEVITGTTAALGIELEHGERTAEQIIEQLYDERVGIQLAYLQVYLDRLYNKAERTREPIVITDVAVQETGKLGDIMADFLADQSAAIQAQLSARHQAIGPAKDSVSRLLEEFVTVDGTKQPVSRVDLVARLPGTATWIDDALSALQSARILRKVNDRFELAHDSLAKSIAESRSAERRQVLAAQKIVRDELAQFAERKKYLDAEDLAVVNHSRRQRDPIRGTPLLELTPDEEEFIRKSSWKLRWKRSRFFIFNAVFATILLLSFGGFIYLAVEMDNQAVAATHDSDRLTFSIFSNLDEIEMSTEEERNWLQQQRKSLLEDSAALNARREVELAVLENDPFWDELKNADLLATSRDNGDQQRGRASYQKLEEALDAQLAGDQGSLRTRARLIALQRRMYWSEPDKAAGAEHLRRILTLSDAPDDYLPVDLYPDFDWACERLEADQAQKDPRCSSAQAASTAPDPAT